MKPFQRATKSIRLYVPVVEAPSGGKHARVAVRSCGKEYPSPVVVSRVKPKLPIK